MQNLGCNHIVDANADLIRSVAALLNTCYDVFNDVFTDLSERLRGAVGVDCGRFLIAHIGTHGDRELISLGSPANIAAKIIGESGTITVPERIYLLLPTCLQEKFEKSSEVTGVQTYQASGLRWKKYPELAEKLNVTFDHDKWQKRTQEAKDNLPLSEMKISGVEGPIDLDSLTERNSKRMDGTPKFADVDGFTKCVEQAEKDDDVKSLVRVFHLIRTEFQAVIESDFNGLALQHQGDCVLGLAYLPSGDDNDDRRRRKGLDIAIGIQSSMEHVLQSYIGRDRILHVAIGLAAGQVLLTRLGKRGERELIALSPPVDESQRLQRMSEAKQIRITKGVYEAIIDENIKEEFSANRGTYVATDLTFPKLDEKDEKKEEATARSGKLATQSTGSGIAVVSSTLSPARPFGWED